MAMTEKRMAKLAARPCRCGGRMVRAILSSSLSVRHVGESSADYWSASPLVAYTCVECGLTDLFVEDPGAIA